MCGAAAAINAAIMTALVTNTALLSGEEKAALNVAIGAAACLAAFGAISLFLAKRLQLASARHDLPTPEGYSRAIVPNSG
ncbi:MAG: hypothetical protein L0Y44_04980 [Phycisphaerales bacterium]|nr:hypothetical protein [Phycisphaerales bacterium]MCI0677393.1 hypothetical protein [Phycisphaerales bacterium]